MKLRILFTLQLLFSVCAVMSQLPGTDIWLVDISSLSDSTHKLNANNITNRQGYDNQPVFSPKGDYLLYSSVRDDKKSHIFRYDFKSGNTIPYTLTSTSEYSPAFIPGTENISVVMVEPDSTQRLWEFKDNGKSSSVLIKNIDSVGYYCWVNKKNLVLNIITQPPTLYCVNTAGKVSTHTLKIDVGRCFQKYKKGVLLTAKTDSLRTIYYFNEHHKLIPQINCLEGSEDFCLLNENTIIMAKGHTLYKYEIGKKKEWELFAILSGNITRLTVSPDGKKLAVVISE